MRQFGEDGRLSRDPDDPDVLRGVAWRNVEGDIEEWGSVDFEQLQEKAGEFIGCRLAFGFK